MQANIRVATENDAAAVAAIYGPYVRDTAISFEAEPPTPEEMGRRIATTLRQYPWLVCERGGELLGYAYGGQFRVRAAYLWSVEMTVYVDRGAHRRGVGRGLYAALLRILPRQHYFNAFALITMPNPGSVALHESVGFTPVGVYHRVGYKHGAWHDVGSWEMALRPPATPEPPVPFAALHTSAEVEAALAAGLPFLRV